MHIADLPFTYLLLYHTLSLSLTLDVSVVTSVNASQIAGEEFSIICSVTGINDLDTVISWIAPDNHVLMETKNVTLTYTFTASISDAGHYTCKTSVTFSMYQESPLNLTSKLTVIVKCK